MSEWYESKAEFRRYYDQMLDDLGELDLAVYSAPYIYPAMASAVWVGGVRVEVSESVKKAIMAMPQERLRRLNIREGESGAE